MDKELKTCPFCGEDPIKYRTTTGVYYVECDNKECFVNGETSAWSEKGVIEQWNTRDTSYRDRVIEAVDEFKNDYINKDVLMEFIKEVKP